MGEQYFRKNARQAYLMAYPHCQLIARRFGVLALTTTSRLLYTAYWSPTRATLMFLSPLFLISTARSCRIINSGHCERAREHPRVH